MNKTEILSQGGAGSPVPSPLCEAKAVCTEPGTPRILQVPFLSRFSNSCGFKDKIIQDLPETHVVLQGEAWLPAVWTSGSGRHLGSKTGSCKRVWEGGDFKIPSILPRILERFLPMLEILHTCNIMIHCRLWSWRNSLRQCLMGWTRAMVRYFNPTVFDSHFHPLFDLWSF